MYTCVYQVGGGRRHREQRGGRKLLGGPPARPRKKPLPPHNTPHHKHTHTHITHTGIPPRLRPPARRHAPAPGLPRLLRRWGEHRALPATRPTPTRLPAHGHGGWDANADAADAPWHDAPTWLPPLGDAAPASAAPAPPCGESVGGLEERGDGLDRSVDGVYGRMGVGIDQSMACVGRVVLDGFGWCVNRCGGGG
jgi:hypothetical protein